MNQQEWTQLAQDKGLKIVMLETAGQYVVKLQSDKDTSWRDYYEDVSTKVFQQQSARNE